MPPMTLLGMVRVHLLHYPTNLVNHVCSFGCFSFPNGLDGNLRKELTCTEVTKAMNLNRVQCPGCISSNPTLWKKVI